MSELTLALYASGLANPAIKFHHLVYMGDYSYWVTIENVDFNGYCTIDGSHWSTDTTRNNTIDNELKAAFEELKQLIS